MRPSWLICFLGTKLVGLTRTGPLTLPLSPNTESCVGGEGKTGNADPGQRARGRRSRSSCLALALGYNPLPRWGSMRRSGLLPLHEYPISTKLRPSASQTSNLKNSCLGLLLIEVTFLRENDVRYSKSRIHCYRHAAKEQLWAG